jgi:phosphohistidine phosphatase
MELYFLRHGDAGTPPGWKGTDEQRPLSREGAARMRREAKAIARLRLPLEAILASPLLRARQTAEIVARAVGLRDGVSVDERLRPGFGKGELEQILIAHRVIRGLMLVGHEPDFSRVISAWTGGGRVEMQKGSLARVDLPTLAPGAGVLAWLLPPGVLAP